MSPALPLLFAGVAAAMFGAGVSSRRSPERNQDPRLLFVAGGLFLLAAFAFLLSYLFA
ncbi:hypothetical protein [uncultured Sphingomonas sp.]|uniref:hypothetical protein n=1 Tax=uncultured Sphingomonas sp. TaxID=158754 RepID=UPI0025907989|nr:hypothetical protein [uncultured Sphingomonas sp.]